MGIVRLVADLVVLVGLGFLTLSLVGLVRFPDLWRKLHAAAIVHSLGLMLVLAGALGTGEGPLVGRAVLIVALLALAGPLTTHLIAHATLHARWDREGDDDPPGDSAHPRKPGGTAPPGAGVALNPDRKEDDG